jgi:hypothetical protein
MEKWNRRGLDGREIVVVERFVESWLGIVEVNRLWLEKKLNSKLKLRKFEEFLKNFREFKKTLRLCQHHFLRLCRSFRGKQLFVSLWRRFSLIDGCFSSFQGSSKIFKASNCFLIAIDDFQPCLEPSDSMRNFHKTLPVASKSINLYYAQHNSKFPLNYNIK